MTGSPVRYTAADGIGHVQLNRPESGNALDLTAARALIDAVEQASRDESARVVLLSGAGQRFCAGGDIRAFSSADDTSAEIGAIATAADRATQALDALDKPIVAAVQGAAAGAGLALMLSADIVVAERSTKFVAAYSAIGLTPDVGLSWVLPRAVGQQRALDFVLTGRVLRGEEAAEWGLVSRVVDDGESLRTATELATQLAAGPTPALGWARRLVRTSWDTSRAQAGREEARTIALAAGTAASVALVDAFTKRS